LRGQINPFYFCPGDHKKQSFYDHNLKSTQAGFGNGAGLHKDQNGRSYYVPVMLTIFCSRPISWLVFKLEKLN